MCSVSSVGVRGLSWTKRLLRCACTPGVPRSCTPAAEWDFHRAAERQTRQQHLENRWRDLSRSCRRSPPFSRGPMGEGACKLIWVGVWEYLSGIRRLVCERQCPAARSGSPGYCWRGGGRTELSVTRSAPTSTSSSSSGSRVSGVPECEGWLPGNAAVLCVSSCSAAWRSLSAQKPPAAVSRGSLRANYIISQQLVLSSQTVTAQHQFWTQSVISVGEW